MAGSLLRGHEKYRRRAFGGSAAFLQQLASEGQSPDAVFVGCSDSRVVPELLTSSSPGDLFVVRNIANVVPRFEHADASVGAALEYGVGHLGIRHLVICGHTSCGGVRGAIDGIDRVRELPSLHEWLAVMQPAVDRVRALCATAGQDLPDDEFWRRVVEENVVEQLGNVLSYPMLARAVEAGELQIHGWVYDLGTLKVAVYDADGDRFVEAGGAILG